MITFEEQIVVTLTELLADPDDSVSTIGATTVAQVLAPRVAAAIDEAVYEFARSEGDPTNDSPTWQQAALSALRGETPGNNSEVGGSA